MHRCALLHSFKVAFYFWKEKYFVRVWLYRSWSALGALVTANALTVLVCLFVCFCLFLSVSVARDVRCGGGSSLKHGFTAGDTALGVRTPHRVLGRCIYIYI
jgi:hypothetical protein